MTLHATDFIVIVVLMAVAFAASYLLLLGKVRAIVTDRQLKIAEQLGSLDEAIRAIETRLTEHQQMFGANESLDMPAGVERITANTNEIDAGNDSEESGEIAPEIQAAIAAATVAALGQNAVVRSMKPVTSPWSQQGRVLVQGSHNLRVRRES